MSESEYYIKYFEEQIEQVSKLENDVYKKILFSCILDTLSIVSYPRKKNKEKYVLFLVKFSNYKDFNLVSLYQLKYHIEYIIDKPERQKSKLYTYVNNNTNSLSDSRIYRGYEIDKKFDELQKQTSNATESKLLKLTKYSNLFYAYRNNLIHTFKEPSYPMEMLSRDNFSPFYHGYINDKTNKELVFPVMFFKNVCKECLAKLKTYIIENDINLEKIYKFGPCWTSNKMLDIIKKKLCIANGYEK